MPRGFVMYVFAKRWRSSAGGSCGGMSSMAPAAAAHRAELQAPALTCGGENKQRTLCLLQGRITACDLRPHRLTALPASRAAAHESTRRADRGRRRQRKRYAACRRVSAAELTRSTLRSASHCLLSQSVADRPASSSSPPTLAHACSSNHGSGERLGCASVRLEV